MPAHSKSTRFARVFFSLLITVAWTATMTMLWRQNSSRGGQGLRAMGMTPEELLVTWRDYEHLMWIERNDRKIGATHLLIKRLTVVKNEVESSTGYQMESRTQARLALGGGFLGALEVPVSAEMLVTMSNDFEMQEFQAHITAAGQSADVQAFALRTALYYRVKINGGESAETAGENAGAVDEKLPSAQNAAAQAGAPIAPGIPGMLRAGDYCGSFQLSGPIILTSVIDPIVTTRSEDMKPGKTWTTRAVNPLLGSQGITIQVKVEDAETIESNGAKIKAWRLRERAEDLETVSWYDADGHLLRSTLPSGIALERTDFLKVNEKYPGFGADLKFEPIDRAFIAGHQDPKLKGRGIEDVLPLAGMF